MKNFCPPRNRRPQTRRAGSADAFELIRLYQESCRSAGQAPQDPVLGDLRRLEAGLGRKDQLWVVAERHGALEAFVSADLEPDNRLAKIQRMAAAGIGAARGKLLSQALGFLMREIVRSESFDVCYSTTRTLTLEEQAVTLEHGFHILGVFPTARSADENRLNGLTAWYADGILTGKRYSDFALHPVVEPFYELARRQCGLKALPKAAAPVRPQPQDGAPALELVEAPLLVAERFKRLRQRRNLSVNFYPFQSPNALLLSPDEKVEVFATVSRRHRFTTIIGEHLSASLDPVALYREVARILYESGVRYIEIINDAADTAGIDSIRRAGYSPCGYFPCLKNAGGLRRDYVVFAKSFEFFTYKPLPVHPLYTRFLQEFCRARNTVAYKDHVLPASA